LLIKDDIFVSIEIYGLKYLFLEGILLTDILQGFDLPSHPINKRVNDSVRLPLDLTVLLKTHTL